MKKIFNIAFILISIFTIFEYLFVFGMITGPLVMALTCIIGIANIVLAAKERNDQMAVLYAIATIALSLPYWKAMFI